MSALADDLYAFLDRPRGARPHFHACTECYEDEACGLDCTTDEDEDNPAVQRGGFGVCSLCKRAAAVVGATKRTTRPTYQARPSNPASA